MIGYCRFCQQGRTVTENEVYDLLHEMAEDCEDFEITEERIQAAANYIAMMECRCDGADHERFVKMARENAMENIDTIFAEKDEYMIQYLKEGVELICSGHVRKITIDTGRGVKATLGWGRSGVKVKRERKITEESE